MPRNLSIQKMLQEARKIKTSSREICEKFVKKYKNKIVEFSTKNNEDSFWNMHEVVVFTKENKKIEFDFYDSKDHDFQMIFKPKYDKVIFDELVLVIELLKLWEQQD